MCGYFCIGFIDFLLKGKSLLDYNLFSNNYEKNDKIILKNFQKVKRWKNYIVSFAISLNNLKNLEYHTSQEKHKFFILFELSAKMKMKNYLEKKNQLRY